MDLLDLLKNTGGRDSMAEMARSLGLGSGDAGRLVEALGPPLTRGLSRQTDDPGGLDNLARALESGNHQRYIDNPQLMRDEATRIDGNKILGHIFGSKDVSRNVAAKAAGETGIDASLIKKALPLLAGLVMSAMSKKTNAGRDIGSASGGLGPLGSLLGGGDGFGLDDVLNLARRFF